MAIVNRSTSFSAASITTVQSSGYTSAFLPRFTPNGGPALAGHGHPLQPLQRVLRGLHQRRQGEGHLREPQRRPRLHGLLPDRRQQEFHRRVQRSVRGARQQQDLGRRLAGEGRRLPTAASPASPFWEAGEVLADRVNRWLAGDASKQRKIYTVAADSIGGYDPTLVQFTSANADRLTPLFQLGGVNGDFCTTLGNLTRHTYATEADCGRDLIDFVNGRDMLFQNPYNRTNPPPSSYRARPNLLGDIFHSTPVLVTPPAPTYLCDLGVVNQCVPSLYDPRFEPRRRGRVRELLLHLPVPDPVPAGGLERRHAPRLQRRERRGPAAGRTPSTSAPATSCGPSSRRTCCPSSSGWRSATATS